MSRQSGFTILELAVVVAIIGIAAAIAIPNMVGSISRGRVNAAARDVVNTIQKARIEAVKQSQFVVLTFDADDNDVLDDGYIAYVDDGQGAGGVAGNWNQDGTERTVYTGRLPAGVTVSAVAFSLGNDETRFNPRAMPSHTGDITLTNGGGYSVTIDLGTGGIPTIQ